LASLDAAVFAAALAAAEMALAAMLRLEFMVAVEVGKRGV
jgi:hypothetical protein